MLPEAWERRRILIWGKTRPELSSKYRELVCTGGVFEDRPGLIRLYPIPLRYLDERRVFKKYQWIRAYVTKSATDARPESYKVRCDDIEALEFIPTRSGNWDERARWILQREHLFDSVEALQLRQRDDHTSLGIVRPKSIGRIYFKRVPEQEKAAFRGRYQAVLSQMELPLDPETGREIRPLQEADYEFKIAFRCQDDLCKSEHNFKILDWEVDAFYFALRRKGNRPRDAAEKVHKKLQSEICNPERATRFFLGNISNHPHVFTIVGLWWPRDKKQRTLFD